MDKNNLHLVGGGGAEQLGLEAVQAICCDHGPRETVPGSDGRREVRISAQSRGDNMWPYLLSIPIAQEKKVRKVLLQQNLRLENFIRVPDKYYSLVDGIMRNYGEEPVGKKSRPASIEVDGVVYKQVQGFEEVFKLVKLQKETQENPEDITDNQLDTSDDNGGESGDDDDDDDGDSNQDRTDLHMDPDLEGKNQEMFHKAGNETDIISEPDDTLDDVEDHSNQSDVDNVGDQENYESGESLQTTKFNSSELKRITDCTPMGVKVTRAVADQITGKPIAQVNMKKNKTISRNNKIKGYMERKAMYKCNECGKVMASQKFYNRHIRMKHSREAAERRAANRKKKQEGMHVCSICQKLFSDRYCLNSHMINMHSESKVTYQCDLCGAIMKFKGSLVQHMKSVHTAERPHSCDLCGKTFKILQQLNNHIKLHDPNYIETCAVCGKTVKKGQISSHMKRHGGQRAHKCTSCDKSFHEKQELQRHLRIHSGEKPYKCPKCNYATAIQGNLTKHLKHVKHKPPTDRTTTVTAPALPQNFYTVHRDDLVRSETEASLQEPTLYMSRDGLPLPEPPPGKLQVIENPHNTNIYRDLSSVPATDIEKAGPRLEVLKNVETMQSSSSIVNDTDTPAQFPGNDMFSYPGPQKMIIADLVPISVSHVELPPGVHVISDPATTELVPGYNHQDPAIYQGGKPDGEPIYTEEQRQYVNTGGGEASSQYRDHYLSYTLMPAVSDSRYSYPNQY